jgi:hypothetical protein
MPVPIDPTEEINQEEITVKLNAEEVFILIRLIGLGRRCELYSPSEEKVIRSICDKFAPGLQEKAAKQLRLIQGGLN